MLLFACKENSLVCSSVFGSDDKSGELGVRRNCFDFVEQNKEQKIPVKYEVLVTSFNF